MGCRGAAEVARERRLKQSELWIDLTRSCCPSSRCEQEETEAYAMIFDAGLQARLGKQLREIFSDVEAEPKRESSDVCHG